jgi:hypothetical protein
MITLEEYLKAIEIVNQYRDEQQRIVIEQSMNREAEHERMRLIKDEILRIMEDEGIDNSKRRDIAQKRQAMMYWLRVNTSLTLYAIGKIFNRDHASVLHACNIAQDAVIGGADYHKDAHDFIKSILPSDYEERLTEFAKSKNYNQNEFRLFSKFIEDDINFYASLVRLKHYLNK